MDNEPTLIIDFQKFERLYRIELATIYCQVPKESLTEEQISGVFVPPIVSAAIIALSQSALPVKD